MKRLPIGISDYKELIDGGFYYIDKTLLIEEITSNSGKVILITRPRRFGKTLNLSMLRYFFETSKEDNSHLFRDTKIWLNADMRKFFGTYPVIFLTFKDIKDDNYDDILISIKDEIATEFMRHQEILLPTLSEFERVKYLSIIDGTASNVIYGKSLKFLSEKLFKCYNKEVIVLLDEYDTPINHAYNLGFYKKTVKFLRSLLTAVLKDNKYLARGIVTGILRAAKEGIFSGLNNFRVASFLDNLFKDKFGFTPEEVDQLLQDYDLASRYVEVKQWYNCYQSGSIQIYNPWSILSYIQEDEHKLKPYWINTSGNELIYRLLAVSNEDIKSDFELLVSDKSIYREISEDLILPNIERNSNAIWSLLLFAGYLTFTKQDIIKGKTWCELKIPNEEIKSLYDSFFKDVISDSLSVSKAKLLLDALLQGDEETFAILFQEYILSSISVYDLPSNEPEKSYHLFVLGLLILLSDDYEIKSNRESGLGRYDIMLIPKDINKLGIIIEFKRMILPREKNLNQVAKDAIEQIKNKDYICEMRSCGIKKVQFMGIAFKGKKVAVAVEKA